MIYPVAVPKMTKPSSFFSWWKYETAPLGLAVQWLVELDTIDPPLMDEQIISAPNVEGEYVDALPEELMVKWKVATEEIMGAIRKGNLPVFGLPKGRGPVQEVPVAWFDECFIKVSHLESDSEIFYGIFNPAPIFLEFGNYENWPTGVGDTLKEKDEIAWSHLVAPVEEIIKIRSSIDSDETGVSGEPSIAPEIIYRTGTAGKPSSWWLVEQEVRGRFAEFPDDIKKADIARLMCKWIKETHPEAPPITEKTVKNNLVTLLIELRALRKSA
jgi:hypothetical protein